MISMLPEPLIVKSGTEGFILFGIDRGEFGELIGLTADADGLLAMRELIWPTYTDWRFDPERDEWSQVQPEPTIPTSTADEELTQRPLDWTPAADL